MNIDSQIVEMRKAIRSHRDQIGDDRCWIDDHAVYNTVPSIRQKVYLPSYEEGMRKCRLFYKNRNTDSVDATPQDAILDPARWNDDLLGMSADDLQEQHAKLEKAIIKHYNIPYDKKTIEDDKELYRVL